MNKLEYKLTVTFTFFDQPIFPEIAPGRLGLPKAFQIRRTVGDCWNWIFVVKLPFLLPNQQCQCAEGVDKYKLTTWINWSVNNLYVGFGWDLWLETTSYMDSCL